MKEAEAGSRGKSNKNLCRYCGKIVPEILENPWSVFAQEFKGAERGGMSVFLTSDKDGPIGCDGSAELVLSRDDPQFTFQAPSSWPYRIELTLKEKWLLQFHRCGQGPSNRMCRSRDPPKHERLMRVWKLDLKGEIRRRQRHRFSFLDFWDHCFQVYWRIEVNTAI